jgi:hypothetical protein
LSFAPPDGDWDRLRALSARERALLLAAALVLPAMIALLPLVGYGRIQRQLLRLPRRGGPPTDADARIDSTVRMVDLAAARLPLRSACLSQSLALSALLRAQGIPAEVRLGVRPGDQPLDAHAWVEYRGRPLNETAEIVGSYTVFRRAGA